ncbi:MAG: bifunctional isocitrate dehydrogenase kinase/phosphatase [Rhodothermales bacterium]
MTDPSPAVAAATRISDGFDAYHTQFQSITARAAERFATQAWRDGAEDDRERLALYEKHVQQALRHVRTLFGTAIEDRDRWAAARDAYASLRSGRPNVELAETFYNSITRRVFSTVGVDPHIEFVADGLTAPESMEAAPRFRTVPPAGTTAALIGSILRSYDLGVPFDDLERDAALVAEEVDACVAKSGTGEIDRVEMLEPVFYRNKGAYLIGRIRSDEAVIPLVLPVLHGDEGGIHVDTVLLTPNATSMVFSFTRSYFHVLAPEPWALVRFLKTLMPLKRIAELYISLGFTKHGKTELYRDLCAFLARTDERFEFARGTKGMVMTVFTLPGYDIVFKVIKDRFDPPKQTTRDEVMKKYRFVMLHDRVGRLADVQSYEHLEFPRDRFVPEVLEELLKVAAQTIHLDGDSVVIDHLYTERRVTPLNLYLGDVDRDEAEDAVIDCGDAIRDLAAADIFPGDMLVKNFGVTRHGRVIFYDYDELGLLSEFNFRTLPKPRDEFEMMSADAWFYVAPNDVFPAEIGKFLGLTKELNAVFHEHHGDLLDPAFWRRMQARQQTEELVDIFPYRQSKRFSKG